MNALEKLESTIATLRRDVPTVRVGGMVSEVTPTHFSRLRPVALCQAR